MNIFQKQLIIDGKTQAQQAVDQGWYGGGLEFITTRKPISIEDFEKLMKYDDDETPETEPQDEPPVILDGDDDAGEDTNDS